MSYDPDTVALPHFEFKKQVLKVSIIATLSIR